MTKPPEKQDLTETTGKSAVKQVVVGEDDAGSRLDRFLTRQYPGVPRTRLFRIVRKGEVRVNGKRAAIDTRLAAGDTVRLPPVRTEAPGEEGGDDTSVGGRSGAAGAGAAARAVTRAAIVAAVTIGG